MKKLVVIYGAGGHGREIADILRHKIMQRAKLKVLGFIDDNSALHEKYVDDLMVLGDYNWLKNRNRGDINVICAMGWPHLTRIIVNELLAINSLFLNVVSPLACVSGSAKIGNGVTLFPQTFVSNNAVIEDYSTLNVGATVSHDTKIGRFCIINPGAHLAGNVTLGEGCMIGMGANIKQGISIGAWTIVGAGAAVVKDLPPNATAVGVPARVIKTREELWYEK